MIDHFALLALVPAAANSSSAVSRLSVFACRKSERFGLCQSLCFPPRTSRFLFSRPFVCAATGRWERGGTLEGDGLPQNSTSRFGDSLPLRARLAQSLPRSPIFFSLPASPIRARECGRGAVRSTPSTTPDDFHHTIGGEPLRAGGATDFIQRNDRSHLSRLSYQLGDFELFPFFQFRPLKIRASCRQNGQNGVPSELRFMRFTRYITI